MIYHLHNPNEAAMARFARKPGWQDRPFWMLNTFRYKPGEAAAAAASSYGKRMQPILADAGAHLVMQAPVTRTAIGEREWGAAAIVAYPHPEAFHNMATGAALEAAARDRIASFADQYLIPMSPRWIPAFDPDAPVRPRSDVRTWDRASLAATPNAFVGEHPTQMSLDRAVALLDDPRFDHGQPVWMLNLLRYAAGDGKRLHDNYVAAGGQSFPGGSLGRQFGLRVVYSARATFDTLIGDVNWDSVAIVQYPSVHHFLTMGANEHYIHAHQGRIDGLAQTYIIAMQPRYTAG